MLSYIVKSFHISDKVLICEFLLIVLPFSFSFSSIKYNPSKIYFGKLALIFNIAESFISVFDIEKLSVGSSNEFDSLELRI